MRAFLTGATGSVGREVCRRLLAAGVEVRVGARASSRLQTGCAERSDMVPLDFTASNISPSTFEGVDAFFFMTPLIDDQLGASLRVLGAAIDGGVRHIVRLSSRSVLWDHETQLRTWHREIDGAVQGSRASWTILRPCSHFQNFIRDQAKTIKFMSAVIVPQGDGLIPYIDAADVGEAAAQCMMRPEEHGGEVHVLTGGRAYGVKGVAAEIGRVISKPVTYIDVEEDRAREMMMELGVPEWLIEARLAVFAHAKAGGEASVDPSLTEIIDRPATSLSEFVDRSRAAWL